MGSVTAPHAGCGGEGHCRSGSVQVDSVPPSVEERGRNRVCSPVAFKDLTFYLCLCSLCIHLSDQENFNWPLVPHLPPLDKKWKT